MKKAYVGKFIIQLEYDGYLNRHFAYLIVKGKKSIYATADTEAKALGLLVLRLVRVDEI